MGAVGIAVVVAGERVEIVGVGADDGDGLERFRERQRVVFVLQQHDGFARGFERELAMRRAVVHADTESARTSPSPADRTCRDGSAP